MMTVRERGRLGHAYLITGPDGSGKESLACRLVAGFLGVEEPQNLDDAVRHDVLVVRPASKSRKIRNEDVHDVQAKLRLSTGGRLKIVVFVDADRMGEPAQNTFLRTLEEPPSDSLILMLSSRPEILLPTILSRCINLSLQEPARITPPRDSRAGRLLAALSQHGTLRDSGARSALLLARLFTLLLEEIQQEQEARTKAMLKEEKEHYQKTTGAGDWLKEREESLEALARSDYLAERTALHALFLSWFGDAVRIASGASHRDLPECEAALAELAKREPAHGLLKRLAEMERLRGLFETNVTEALAIEVCFLRAFS